MTRTKRTMHVAVAAIALAIAGAGCSGSDGAQGPQGSTGPTGPTGAVGPTGPSGSDATAVGTLSGTIKDAYGNLVAGAKVTFTVGSELATTATADASGRYTVEFPPGARTVTFSGTGYTDFSQSVEVRPTQTVTLNVTLNPKDRVAVNVAATAVSSTSKGAGSQWTLTPTVAVFDPALRNVSPTYAWTVLSGPAPSFSATNVAAPTLTLAGGAAFKTAIATLAAPYFKVNPDEPPVSIDRYQIMPLSYEQALSQGNVTKLRLTVTYGAASFSTDVSVAATLPFQPTTGLNNVPVGTPVILQGQFPFTPVPKASWSWSVNKDGAAVAVNDAATPYPDFVPTTAGEYVVSEGGWERFRVVAGTYVGVMSGPGTTISGCNCHSATFTAWRATGHKEVIWNGIEELPPGGHYAASCTPCHTVGNGAKGAGGYADKITGALAPDFATTLQGNALAEQVYWQLYPQSAPLTGVQCENCHGPQSQTSHATATGEGVGNGRISFSSSTCATCHARAPKHGRYPQWLQSGHASFATFTFNSNADGTLSNSCACCHSAQGFAAYRAILPTANGNRSLTTLPAGLTVANAQPITCPTCHVSHDEGALLLHEEEKGVLWTNLAKVGPAEGETYMLPSGFAAAGVGKGALCIACHNSRQGIKSGKPALHEDGDATFGTLASYGAPHEACQGDVLMGRNAYWLGAATHGSPATRSKHSYITNTCVTCHMELTDVLVGLGEEGQTRHDFKATPDVCNRCHTAYSTEAVQGAFEERFLELRQAVGTAILKLKSNADPEYLGSHTAVLVANRSGQVDVTDVDTGVTQRWFINDKAGQDAFVWDPNYPGTTQAVSGCTAPALDAAGAWVADCTGFLSGAIGYAPAEVDPSTVDTALTADGVNGTVAKALWNAVLVQDDASKGVHNPTFTFEVIDATIRNASAFTK